jgi:hypothetical protein
MKSIVRSVAGAALQTSEYLGLPHVFLSHSTLNEKFNINAAMMPADTDIPHIRYACIGNGGHSVVIGSNNIALNKPIQHKPRHTGLYRHLPFVLRPLTSDLTPQQRAKYRLRNVLTIDGVAYAAYWLKVLDLSTSVVECDYYTVSNGVTTSTTFAPNSNDLSPTPPDLSSTGVVSTSGDYIAASSKVPFDLNDEDILELGNVANIMYGDKDYAIISEIGLCSGVDKVVTGDFNGVQASYTEAIGVQIANFVCTYLPTQYLDNDLSLEFDVGSVEPMLTLST